MQQDKGRRSAGLSGEGSACHGTLDKVARGDVGEGTSVQRPEGSKGASRAAVSAHAKALGWELGVPWWGLEVSVVEMEPLSLRRAVGLVVREAVRGQTAQGPAGRREPCESRRPRTQQLSRLRACLPPSLPLRAPPPSPLCSAGRAGPSRPCSAEPRLPCSLVWGPHSAVPSSSQPLTLLTRLLLFRQHVVYKLCF